MLGARVHNLAALIIDYCFRLYEKLRMAHSNMPVNIHCNKTDACQESVYWSYNTFLVFWRFLLWFNVWLVAMFQIWSNSLELAYSPWLVLGKFVTSRTGTIINLIVAFLPNEVHFSLQNLFMNFIGPLLKMQDVHFLILNPIHGKLLVLELGC